MEKTRLSGRFWCALTLFSLVGQVAWVVENMYLNIFIYKMFRASAADISMMVGASAVAATLTTVLMGALSDRVGKRKLFICGGYLTWGVSVLCFALLRVEWISAVFPMAASAAALGVTLTILLDCVMTFFGSGANDAAFNAWVTDMTDSTNRGAAEGINAMMPLIAILVVFGGFMGLDLDRADSWTVIFCVIGGVVTLVGLLGIFLIQDSPVRPTETGYLYNVTYGFRPSTAAANPALYFYLAAYILFNISIQTFMPYLILYYEVALGLDNYVLIMAPAILIAAAVTAFWGKVYDKRGFAFSGFFALGWLAAGYILLAVFRAVVPVFLGSLLMMCGYLSGMAVFGAKIRDLTPAGKAGMLQGVRIFSQVLIPGVVGPWIGQWVLRNADTVLNDDGTYSFIPNANIFWAALCSAAVLIIGLSVALRCRPQKLNKRLTTPFEDALSAGEAPSTPTPAPETTATPPAASAAQDLPLSWSDHPRPQLRRDTWRTLCGKWSLAVKKGERETDLGEVMVPYPPESRLSGIERTLKRGEKWVYRRNFTLPEHFSDKKVLLHFGAVDQIARVLVNGVSAGEHTGGYLPFSLDITRLLRENENLLEVEVTDDLDLDIPYGKQRRRRGGMWYTPVSGIWQPVWLEGVPEEYVTALRLTSTLESVTLETRGGAGEKTVTVETPDGPLTVTYTGDTVTLPIPDPRLWTPDTPYLYPFTLTAGDDVLHSYFALRTVSIQVQNGHPYICLNGVPTFFHGLLDQGYFSDGIYLPATPEGYEFDVKAMKDLGFNMLRKHIKIEPEAFYYACDRLGMLVFQDMVNSGRYHYLRDTAMPTVWLRSRRGGGHRASRRRRAIFEADARGTVDHLYNHPSVVYYTIFNEGWGQFDADGLYRTLKEYDPSRVWDPASGWFTGGAGDVVSEHYYFRPVTVTHHPQRPSVLSEFGGISCKLPDHAFNLSSTYGYGDCDGPEGLQTALERLYRDEILPAIAQGLNAAVYTQVSDVEDETNGLVTYDRRVIKPDPARMRALAEELFRAFREETGES